jgi:hypothetical protein
MPDRPARTSAPECRISSGSATPAAAARARLGVARHLDRLIFVLGALSAALAAAFLFQVGRYYALPLWERPDSPLHAALRPSGSVGHPFAWVGSAVLLVGVGLYSGRKRLGVMRGRGPMRTWLNLHIYLCLAGPFLVALHTALKLRGLGVYSFWSMMIVAASGIIGRWLYQQFPRTIKGEAMTLEEIRAEQAELRSRLSGEFRLPSDLLAEIDDIAQRSVRRIRSSSGEGLLALPLLFADDLARPLRLAWLQRRLRKARHIGRQEASAMVRLIRHQVATARRLAFLDTFRRVFAWWHVIHLVFFVAMIVLLVLHVASEVFFGAPLVGT